MQYGAQQQRLQRKFHECDHRDQNRVCRRNKLFRCVASKLQVPGVRIAHSRTSLSLVAKVTASVVRKHTKHRICNYIVFRTVVLCALCAPPYEMGKWTHFAFVTRKLRSHKTEMHIAGDRQSEGRMQWQQKKCEWSEWSRRRERRKKQKTRRKSSKINVEMIFEKHLHKTMLFVNTTRICCYRLYMLVSYFFADCIRSTGEVH